jgi:flavin reductase (DIM6/NTAB) family NADH-FMN oxidoreductase RutF
VDRDRSKLDIDFREALPPLNNAMSRSGVLLVSNDETGRPGGMTVSWGTAGVMWGRPIFSVMVRPSRHSFGLLEAAGEFTINVMPSEMSDVVDYWGKHSGRDVDKWAKTGLQPAPARRIRAPIVEQGVLHFECRVVYRQDMTPEGLVPELGPAYYASGNYHRIYYGEILACYGM